MRVGRVRIGAELQTLIRDWLCALDQSVRESSRNSDRLTRADFDERLPGLRDI